MTTLWITGCRLTSIVGLIPARGGSKRVKGKNIRELAGKPLLWWSVKAALESGVFENVFVSSESDEILDIGFDAGALPFHRSPEAATDTSPDIDWIREVIDGLTPFSAFAILRPTSPFRTAETIRRAWNIFKNEHCDSLRAVEKVKQHPGKQWVLAHNYMIPLLIQPQHPWHSSQYPTLPEVYVQNASLEIAWTDTVAKYGNQAGERVIPFFTEGWEGFDINTPLDFKMAELLIAEGEVTLDEPAPLRYERATSNAEPPHIWAEGFAVQAAGTWPQVQGG